MGSNHRPPPCQGDALPLSYVPTGEMTKLMRDRSISVLSLQAVMI